MSTLTTPRLVAFCLLASLLTGGLGGAAVLRMAELSNDVHPTTPLNLGTIASSTTAPLLRAEEAQTIDVVQRVSPAVVSIIISKAITARSPDDFFNDLFGNRFFTQLPVPQQKSTVTSSTQRMRVGGGSGFLVAQDGYIVTNRHVVDDKEAEYTVVLQDGRQFAGKVLAVDPTLDLAVVKIEGTGFPFATLGDSDQLRTGQTVIAIGNALAEFQNTVTKGVISGVNRHLVAGGGSQGGEVIEGALQTDAAINPGNSGGPLINLDGQVIGINTATSENAQSLGFALPVNLVKQAVESVKRTGKIIRPWLGVRYVPVDAELAATKHLPHNYGVLVGAGQSTKTEPAVVPDSPAAKAGLVEDDVILEVNGQKLDENHSLAGLIASLVPGNVVTLKVWHDGKEKLLTVTLEERKS